MYTKLLIVLFVFALIVPQSALAQEITPTLYCLGSCSSGQTSATTKDIQTVSPSVSPNVSFSPSTSPAPSQAVSPSPSISPSPSVTPCSDNTKTTKHSKKKKGKHHTKIKNGFIRKFILFLINWIMHLLEKLGIHVSPLPGGGPCPSPTPSMAPSTTPSVAPSNQPSVSPSQPGQPTNTPTPPVTSTCNNPSHVLPLNPSNPQDGITISNFYVDTDTWNAANYQVKQTMYICNYNNWYVIANMNDTGDGAVKTYPNVHEDFNEKPLSSFTTITSSYAHVAPSVGNWDFAYDIWINGVASSGSTELMIWTQAMGKQADAIKGYQTVGTVTLSGINYTIHKNGNDYIAFDMNPYKNSGTINLKEIFNYIISKGLIPSNSTLGAIDYGVEIVSTNGTDQTFKVTNFSLTAN